VSAFEPQLPTEPKVDMPDFMVVLRGYDRRQVEMWATEVANQIEQERLRADEAEKHLYRMQIENKGAPSFSHLGSHVASILEEAGRSSENMLADAADRAQESVDAAEAEAAEIIKAAEHRAGEIEQQAQRTLEDARAEGARVEEDALQAAEEMRVQAEQDARTVLEEARDATDMIWQEAERERIAVEAETIRLETLRHRSLEQLGRVYGHLESVLDEVRAGIGRVEEEEENLEEATAAAAARLGVEPPARSPDASPRFPSIVGDQHPSPRDGEAEEGGGLLAANRPETLTTPESASSSPDEAAASGGPVSADARREPGRPAEADRSGDGDTPPAAGDAEATQQVPTDDQTEATRPVPVAGGSESTRQPANGEGRAADEDATERLEPVGGKSRQPNKQAKDATDRP
jgi:cell division septum initiation protein DivIVA